MSDAVDEVEVKKDNKTPFKLSDLPDRQAALHLLTQNGLTTKQAGKELGYKEKSAYVIKSKLNKLSLKDVKLVKDAHKCVKNLVKGKTFGSIEKVKDSTALAAAEMIYDRAEPVVQKIETKSTSITITADMRGNMRKSLEICGLISSEVGENEINGTDNTPDNSTSLPPTKPDNDSDD